MQRTFTVNTISAFLCYKYAAKQMIKQGRGGRIIGASSLSAKSGVYTSSFDYINDLMMSVTIKKAFPLTTAYSVSKFGIRGLTQNAGLC